ncbi:hypothetical protein C1X68_30410, partial [Pseudomonas sp. FW303-C2]|uniref:hypothetical protein n=1 Tax=Pseudomonas sp. FW303-C2 TaxID=2070640 RepID=UPI000CC9489B
ESTVAQHDDPIGDTLDLFEKVGYVDDGFSGGAELIDDFEKTLDFGFAETAGRLVEDHDAAVRRDRPRKFDELSLVDRQPTKAI